MALPCHYLTRETCRESVRTGAPTRTHLRRSSLHAEAKVNPPPHPNPDSIRQEKG
jgi:hypothetical protein